MGVTEVVRGADLLLSTARQLLLFRALVQGLIIDEETTATASLLPSSSSSSSSLSSGPTNDVQQLLIPSFYHCDLVRDPSTNQRIAKRMQTIHTTTTTTCETSLSQDTFTLQALRDAGWTPDRIRSERLPQLLS